MSFLASPPAAVKNLAPLRLVGRWEAVIMMAPSYTKPGSTQLMNMAGVVQRPKRATATPRLAMPATMEAAISGLDSRGSRPTEVRRAAVGTPARSDRNSAKAAPMKNIIDGVSVTGSPGTTAQQGAGCGLNGGGSVLCRCMPLIFCMFVKANPAGRRSRARSRSSATPRTSEPFCTLLYATTAAAAASAAAGASVVAEAAPETRRPRRGARAASPERFAGRRSAAVERAAAWRLPGCAWRLVPAQLAVALKNVVDIGTVPVSIALKG